MADLVLLAVKLMFRFQTMVHQLMVTPFSLLSVRVGRIFQQNYSDIFFICNFVRNAIPMAHNLAFYDIVKSP